MGNNKSIVITTINNPTESIEKFSKLNGYDLIVVGDKKTPVNWNYDNVNYLSIDNQNDLDFDLIKVLPYNHYCRKMIGYLVAMKNKTEYIIDTDDDNIPYDNWGFPNFYGKFLTLSNNVGYFNVYELFTEQKIWPRGFHLNFVEKNNNIGIWQGLADEDPDVDAIYRLINNIPCYFNKKEPIVLDNTIICPFNSQNTIFVKELFPLLYLPTYVTFRFTDILRGLIAQPIMWLYGYKLGFTEATVIQKRNVHDFMKDFESEIPMYINTKKVIDIVNDVIRGDRTIEENLMLVYMELLVHGIVTDNEIKTLNAWLSDLKSIKYLNNIN